MGPNEYWPGRIHVLRNGEIISEASNVEFFSAISEIVKRLVGIPFDPCYVVFEETKTVLIGRANQYPCRAFPIVHISLTYTRLAVFYIGMERKTGKY